jgi:hypothetical protein
MELTVSHLREGRKEKSGKRVRVPGTVNTVLEVKGRESERRSTMLE